MSPTRDATGAAGEAFVAGRLARQGYRIIARNWRVRGGELDIVALDRDVLVFVEVRVRTGERIVSAEETVDARKLGRIMLAAETFLYEHPEHADAIWRVDLVAITLDATGAIRRYRHMQNLSLD
jgi:putative endonuclease